MANQIKTLDDLSKGLIQEELIDSTGFYVKEITRTKELMKKFPTTKPIGKEYISSCHRKIMEAKQQIRELMTQR